MKRAIYVAYGVVGSLAGVACVLLSLLIAQPARGAETPNTVAAQFGITVITEQHLSCGGSFRVAGCFRPATPDTIYVQAGLDPDFENYVVLHEIGHAMANRLGLPPDECQADRFAQSLGAQMGNYCPPTE